MSIPVTAINDQITSRLDAEGTDHYGDAEDRIPAINGAQDWLVGHIGPVLGQKKFPEKILSELLRTRVWQTSKYGRVYMNDAQLIPSAFGPVWDIVSCWAEPITVPDSPTVSVVNDAVSVLRDEIGFIQSNFPCKRITLEQLADSRNNALMAGSEYMAGSALRDYYYCIHSYGRATLNYLSQGWEIEFGPQSLTDKKLVAITHLKVPTRVVALGDVVEFPPMVLELLVSRALHFLSIKQGDGTNLYNTQEQDTATLMKMLT